MLGKYFDWDDAKNAKARAQRGMGFEDVVFHIERGELLDIHPNPAVTPASASFAVRRGDYVYLVPFVKDEHTVFLKTIIPNRKAAKTYLGEESDDRFHTKGPELRASRFARKRPWNRETALMVPIVQRPAGGGSQSDTVV